MFLGTPPPYLYSPCQSPFPPCQSLCPPPFQSPCSACQSPCPTCQSPCPPPCPPWRSPRKAMLTLPELHYTAQPASLLIGKEQTNRVFVCSALPASLSSSYLLCAFTDSCKCNQNFLLFFSLPRNCKLQAKTNWYFEKSFGVHCLVESKESFLYEPRFSKYKLRWTMALKLFIPEPSFFFDLFWKAFGPNNLFSVIGRGGHFIGWKGHNQDHLQ